MTDVQKDQDILNFLVNGSKSGMPLNDIIEAYMGKAKVPFAQFDSITKSFEEHIQYFPNYSLIKNFLNKKFIMDLQTDQYFLYDEKQKILTAVQKSSLINIFGAKNFQKIQDTRLHSVCLGYNPNTTTLFYDKDDIPHVNLYRPAAWQFPYMYENIAVPKTDLPERYEKFFRHLCDNEEISYTYLINFLAATVQVNKRPLTYLTLVGKQGVGKNTLIEIMTEVLEKNNVTTFTGTSLKDVRFNGSFKNKKLIMFDEVLVKNIDDENFLKDFVNSSINIEEKGKDKKQYDNFASIVLAANSLAAIRISADDRRYSFLDLPDQTLIQFHRANYAKEMSFDIFRKEFLLEPEQLKQLGQFLLAFPVNKKVLDEPLQSKARKHHKRKSLNDWETAVFDVISPKFAGKELEVKDANVALTTATDNPKAKPGRNRWTELAALKPGFFTVIRKRADNGERPYFIKFEPLNKQPHEDLDEDV